MGPEICLSLLPILWDNFETFGPCDCRIHFIINFNPNTLYQNFSAKGHGGATFNFQINNIMQKDKSEAHRHWLWISQSCRSKTLVSNPPGISVRFMVIGHLFQQADSVQTCRSFPGFCLFPCTTGTAIGSGSTSMSVPSVCHSVFSSFQVLVEDGHRDQAWGNGVLRSLLRSLKVGKLGHCISFTLRRTC